jgi:hypothetical protein
MTWLRYFLWILTGVERLMTPIGCAIALGLFTYGLCLWNQIPLPLTAPLATLLALSYYRQFPPGEEF